MSTRVDESGATANGTDYLRAYSGFLTFAAVSDDVAKTIRCLSDEAGVGLDLTQTALEVDFTGRDSNRFVVRLLARIAAALIDADGEVCCEMTWGTDRSFEFFRIRGGKLLCQVGTVVRGHETEVRD